MSDARRAMTPMSRSIGTPVASRTRKARLGLHRSGEAAPRKAVIADRTTRRPDVGSRAVGVGDIDGVEPHGQVASRAGDVVLHSGLVCAPAAGQHGERPSVACCCVSARTLAGVGTSPVKRSLDGVRHCQEGHAAPADDAFVDLETTAQDGGVAASIRQMQRDASQWFADRQDPAHRGALGSRAIGITPCIAEAQQDELRRGQLSELEVKRTVYSEPSPLGAGVERVQGQAPGDQRATRPAAHGLRVDLVQLADDLLIGQ